jgi:hypothetical protein
MMGHPQTKPGHTRTETRLAIFANVLSHIFGPLLSVGAWLLERALTTKRPG